MDRYNPVDDVAEAFRRALAWCDREYPLPRPDGEPAAGPNLPEIIREALETIIPEQTPIDPPRQWAMLDDDGATIRPEPIDGRVAALARHRPGCWEAGVITGLPIV